MALRSVPRVQPRSAGEEPAETLSGATAAHRGPRRHPPAPRAATIPRSPTRACKTLDHVPTVSSGASRPDVQARHAAITWSRSRAAPGSDSGSKRGLARDSGVLPDADSGGIHCSSACIRLHEADHPHSGAARAHHLPPPWRRRARGAGRPTSNSRRRSADQNSSRELVRTRGDPEGGFRPLTPWRGAASLAALKTS